MESEFIDPAQYPRYKHHPTLRPRLVHTPEQEAALSEEWSDKPFDIPEPEVVGPQPADGCPNCQELAAALVEARAGEGCPKCDSMVAALKEADAKVAEANQTVAKQREKFDAAWEEMVKRNEQLSRDNAELKQRAKGRKAKADKEPEGEVEAQASE